MLALGLIVTGCGGGVRTENDTSPPTTSLGATTEDRPGDTQSVETEEEGDDGDKLDAGPSVTSGCQYVDLLFVIDNSSSMATYQAALAASFPGFVEAMFDVLPEGIDVHVGITTTDFDHGCNAQESSVACQTTATVAEVESHYKKPTDEHDGGNGTQGRLFRWAGRHWFETSTDEDPAELVTWFSNAAVAAGEDGCAFEMPVAAAGWAMHPANAETNAGFVRDAGALLVLFFLTDEPDKSPQSRQVYRQMVLDAKPTCGGEDCVFASGLVPPCILDVNQKLWQFMKLWSDEDPPWGNIAHTQSYADHFGDALAVAVAQACADVPIP
jgi:hypothetical protein